MIMVAFEWSLSWAKMSEKYDCKMIHDNITVMQNVSGLCENMTILINGSTKVIQLTRTDALQK